MEDESHHYSEIAKVPGSSASTSSSSDRVISNNNSGRQGDVVMGVGRDYIKNITVYNVNPSDVRNDKRSFGCRFEDTISTGDFVEFEATIQAMNEIMEALKDDKFTAIGIYGMGGIGKTTLVKHVGAQARIIGDFDQVIMAVVSQIPDLRKIQGALADLLGIKLEQETETGRACKLKEVIMKGKRILIILDDLWNIIELSEVGIPSYDKLQRCNSKVIFTTRRLHVCHDMKSQASIPLHILSEEDAWNFFAKNARKPFHESTAFDAVGRQVARECAGLPIALVAVARALANHDIDGWEEAAERLKMSQSPNPEEDDKTVYKCIKLSYDYLKGDYAKPFFLLCCLFPEDDDIPIADLMKYGLGKGLFRDISTIEKARVRANLVAKHLKESSLLLDGKKEGCIRMHDVIRDTAISIASSEGFLVQAGWGLKEWPRSTQEVYSAISLMCNQIHKFPEELVCSKLQILLLQKNYLGEIPEPFFQIQHKALRVLDVSDNYIASLPSSLSFLVNLQALYLDHCWNIVDISILGNLKNLEILSMRRLGLKELPEDIGHLANLRMLDVTAGDVVRVPCKVISRLSRLEELYLQCDFRNPDDDDDDDDEDDDDDAGRAEEEFNLSFHEFLDLKCLTILKVNISMADSLPENIKFYPYWVKFNISFCRKSLTVKYEFADLFSDDYSRTLTLNTTITTLPAWFIEAVTKKTEKLQYVKGKGLSDIVVEHDYGRLQCLKFLSLLGPHNELKEFVNTTRRVPTNEPVFKNLEVLYVLSGSCLTELCVGELPNGSLRNLKLLMVQNCDQMVNALVPSNLLQRLHNLETLICHRMEGLKCVFGTEGLEPKQIVLTTLRHMMLYGLWNLIKIWDGPARRAIFRDLNFLGVSFCGKLKTLLTSDVAQCLLQLEHLWVTFCHSLERVIEPSGETETSNVRLPNLKGIHLVDLPQLTRFYTFFWQIDHIECPSLEHFYVYNCPKLSTSASDFHSRNQVQLSCYAHFIPLSERWLPYGFLNLNGRDKGLLFPDVLEFSAACIQPKFPP